MIKIRFIIFALSLCFIAGLANEACADRRSYVWTYEYQTMPKGKAELEYYITEEQPDIEKAKPNTWKHWFEIEYGITDNWDLSMYQQFKQSNKIDSEKFEYDGFKIRTRYRIMEKDRLPIDTLLYLEYIRNDNLEKPNKIEGKLVLAKDMGDLNIAYNQIIEQELVSDAETEHGYAAAISYKIMRSFKIAVETKGSFTEKEYFAGPTIAWWANRLWVSAGMAWGLNDRSDDLQVRVIAGIGF